MQCAPAIDPINSRASRAIEFLVFVLAPDPHAPSSLASRIRGFGWQVRAFVSPDDFLESTPQLLPSCIVLDAHVHGIDAPALQERVAADMPGLPIVLAVEVAREGATVHARAGGSVHLAADASNDTALEQAVACALERSRSAIPQWSWIRELRARHASLTPRERDVLALVVLGHLNKQVGGALGISEITVKAHRGSIMRKMRACSLPGLVTMAALLGIAVAGAPPAAVPTRLRCFEAQPGAI
jgi:FixJ family two-component response regulator